MTRLRTSFIVVIVVGTTALATLTSALQRPPGPVTGLEVAISGLVLGVALAVATRMLTAVQPVRQRVEIDRAAGRSRRSS